MALNVDALRRKRVQRKRGGPREELLQGYTELFSRPELGVFVTATFRHEPPSTDTATKAAVQFLRRLGGKARWPVTAVVVVDQNPGRVHCHFLLGGVGHLKTKDFRWAWRRGLVDVKRESGIGACRYLAKKVVDEDADFDLWPKDFRRASTRVEERERNPFYQRARRRRRRVRHESQSSKPPNLGYNFKVEAEMMLTPPWN